MNFTITRINDGIVVSDQDAETPREAFDAVRKLYKDNDWLLPDALYVVHPTVQKQPDGHRVYHYMTALFRLITPHGQGVVEVNA